MNMTFGGEISRVRKALGLSQRDLAAKILKEDGQPISPQYLNDIEHDRRNPPSEEMINQIARLLKLEPEFLYYLAKTIPSDVAETSVDKDRIVAAYRAFRKQLKGK